MAVASYTLLREPPLYNRILPELAYFFMSSFRLRVFCGLILSGGVLPVHAAKTDTLAPSAPAHAAAIPSVPGLSLIHICKILAKRAERIAIERVPDVAHQLQVKMQIVQADQDQCENFTGFE